MPVNTTRTLKDEEAEKKHKLTKDWPVICYPIFFHAFFLLHGLFLFSGQIQSLDFLPGGNWIFWGEFEMFLNFSQRRLNFSFEEIVFPPEGNCIYPQPIRGNSIFSRGESRKKSPFLFVFLQIGIIPGEIFVLGNFPRWNSHFPHKKFPFPPFLSGEEKKARMQQKESMKKNRKTDNLLTCVFFCFFVLQCSYRVYGYSS